MLFYGPVNYSAFIFIHWCICNIFIKVTYGKATFQVYYERSITLDWPGCSLNVYIQDRSSGPFSFEHCCIYSVSACQEPRNMRVSSVKLRQYNLVKNRKIKLMTNVSCRDRSNVLLNRHGSSVQCDISLMKARLPFSIFVYLLQGYILYLCDLYPCLVIAYNVFKQPLYRQIVSQCTVYHVLRVA